MTADSISERARAGSFSLVSRIFEPVMFRSIRQRFVPIFMLHRMQRKGEQFSGHSVEILRRALEYTRRCGYVVVSLDDLCEALHGQVELPPRAVVFTCDDGFADQIEIAAPVFEEFRSPVTIFLLTDFVDGKDWPWDYKVQHIISKSPETKIQLDSLPLLPEIRIEDDTEKREAIAQLRRVMKRMPRKEVEGILAQLSERANVEVSSNPPNEYRALSWDAARKSESPYVRFGAHSASHMILSQLSSEECRQELLISQRRLREELQYPSQVFCYPTGRYGKDFGEREIKLLQETGCRAAIAADPGYVDLEEDGRYPALYRLRRFGFPNRMSDFIQYCSWIERIKEKIRA